MATGPDWKPVLKGATFPEQLEIRVAWTRLENHILATNKNIGDNDALITQDQNNEWTYIRALENNDIPRVFNIIAIKDTVSEFAEGCVGRSVDVMKAASASPLRSGSQS
eukprot:GHVU01047973.1.p1 GENE.GHVU01047973.1~~GHVU01047973.1.p1  ORF type:complete len:109 (-),score=16.53 GHVU01047973.1:11-337(-)